jgi:hypothetical protein
MTPEAGRFSQMMLGVTRSLGDFYHQQYGEITVGFASRRG